ncbi:MAG TPA: PAS domain S-box protein [Gammaproteobacteria bacterium]|nr:PAS domain S-box protein [Gammaproteobacteria bacterium]
MAFPSLDRFLARKHTKICIAYLLAASAYIIVSGWVVATTMAADTQAHRAELLKGLGFVLVTTVLLWLFLDRAYSSRMFGELTFKTLVASLPDAVLVLRLPERGIVYANPAAERMFGFPAGGLAGASTEILHVSQERFRDFREAGVATLAADEPFCIEGEMRRRDGSIFPSEHIVSTFELDHQGTFAVSIIRDITERRQRDEALRDSEQRFRQIAENLREVFWISNPDKSAMEYVSPAYEQIWGRPADGVYADPLSFLDALHPDDRERVAGLLPLQAAGQYDTEYRIVRPDGEVAWIWDRAVPIADADGRVYRIVGVAEDVTKLKQAEAQLHQVQKIEAIGNLAGGVAHDFNNLLTVILGNLDALQSAPGKLSTGQRASVGAALEAAERAAGLTRQLLAFSRTQLLMPRPTAVNDLIAELMKLVSRTLGEDVEVSLRPAADLPEIHVDPAQLETTILNIVLNARDAMPDGGQLTITTARRAVARRDADAALPVAPGDYIAIAIADTGTGMPAAVHERIFEPFFTTKEVGKGTGLGLSTAFGFIRQSRGGLSVDSEPGKGTTFRILLPVRREESDESRGAGDAAPCEAPELAAKRILVVDDDVAVRATIAAQLRALGCAVIEAGEGQAALDMLEDEAPAIDLVISDHVMPGRLSGLDLAREVAARWPGLRFVLCSGRAERTGPDVDGAGPRITYLSKPFRAEDLARTLGQVFGEQ